MEEINITNHSPFAKVNHFAQCWVKDRMYLDEIEELMQDALSDVHEYAEKHHLPMPKIRKMIQSLERSSPKVVWETE